MKLATTCMLLAALGAPTALRAAEPPREPILRIETEMHTAMIIRIGVDAANRWLVTGSEDKTVRVWNLATGELVRVLRPPIGTGNEGKIYAVAISPDGNTVACGGWDVGAPPNGIYLFDRSSGRLVQRVTGLPNVINHLVFSPDGRFFAATLGAGGLRVYRASDFREVARDADYGSQSYGADFAADGRLATACVDGFVRLYDRGFKLTAKQRAPGGNEPVSVAFAPDGTKIAVGFNDSTKVNVLSARDLSLLYAPDTRGVDKGNMSVVAFSADGARLAAGGRRADHLIRVWEQAGRGGYRDLLAAGNTIMHILPLNDGGFVFGAADPAWGMFDAAGQRRTFRKADLADLRDQQEKFLVSADGGRVQFGYQSGGKSPAGFSVLDKQLEEIPNLESRISKLAPPRTSAPGLEITGWIGKTPAVNGKRLALDEYEESRSVAIAPSGESFLLGTEWNLRLFDRAGQEKWNLPVPGTACAVNIAENGAVALAALDDGTIRWYRLSDGKELLAFFPHGDRKRWVLWTPSGYYDASLSAEEFIGWHVNNIGKGELRIIDVEAGKPAEKAGMRAGDVVVGVDGQQVSSDEFGAIIRKTATGISLCISVLRDEKKVELVVTPDSNNAAKAPRIGVLNRTIYTSVNASDFFPVSRFRNTFYRPDVISKILDTRDEAEAVRLANAEAGRRAQITSVAQLLPPVVTVLSPQDGASVSTEEIEVRYTARATEDAPVTAVRVLVDGRPFEGTRGIAVEAAAAERSLKVRLPGRDCEVALVAENRHGASEPARLRLKWGGKPTEEFVAKPKLYALLIGVSQYADDKIRLKYAAKDARDFAAALEKQKGGLYRDVTIKLLTDQQAAKDEILDALDWVRKQATSKDIAVVFLSGHGVNDSDGSYYYLPVNVNVEKLMRTGVRFSDIRETVASIAGKALFFVDTCHAGNVIGGRRGVEDMTRMINELASAENGAVVFAASTGRQYSLENDDWQNGAFTKALVEGLAGKADYGGKGKITINMLDLWLSERVKELTGGKQTPTTTKPQTIPDFPVAMPVR